MKSTKEKIDEILGIGQGQTVDDIFDNLSADISKAKTITDDLDSSIREDFNDIDKQMDEISQGTSNSILALNDLQASLKEVEDLIMLSKQIFRHIYDGIVSSELLDSELIGSAGKFLEALHLNIDDFISLYRDKMRFVEKVKLMAYAQEQKKELMQLKFDLEMQKMREKDKMSAVDVDGQPAGGFSFTVEDVTKALQNLESNGKSVEEAFDLPEVKIPDEVIDNDNKDDENE